MTSRLRRMNVCGGFTLIELLIVIVIIALLMTIAMIAVGPILERVSRVRCGAQISSVFTSYMSYVTQQSKIFPPLYDPKEYNFQARTYTGSLRPFDNYFITNSKAGFSAGFGPLVAHGLIKSEYFICPDVADTEDAWWRMDPVANAEYWWQEKENQNPERLWRERGTSTQSTPNTYASYCIRHKLYPWTPAQVGSGQDPAKTHVASSSSQAYNLIKTYGRRAILADNLTTLDMVTQRHGTGVNVAFIDGSVEFREGEEFMGMLKAVNGGTSEAALDDLWAILDLGVLNN